MSINQDIRVAAGKLGIPVTDHDVAKIVGTIRVAGVTEASPQFDELVGRALQKIGTKEVVQEHSFEHIDASIEKGACPRCGKAMRHVKLADYTDALFCAGDCRITLWNKNDKPAEDTKKQTKEIVK